MSENVYITSIDFYFPNREASPVLFINAGLGCVLQCTNITSVTHQKYFQTRQFLYLASRDQNSKDFHKIHMDSGVAYISFLEVMWLECAIDFEM